MGKFGLRLKVGLKRRPADGIVACEYPNFLFIRLIAAATVIFSHAFLIAEGIEDNEPLVRLLGPHNILGIYGVFIFFFASGFLLPRAQSTAVRCSAMPGSVSCASIPRS